MQVSVIYKAFLSLLIVSCLTTLVSWPSSAQRTVSYDDPLASFNLAMDLFNKEKYTAAQEVFRQVTHRITDPHSVMRIQAAYYDALCAYELHHQNATELYVDFIRTYPENTMAQLAQFQLARLHYRNKEYRPALEAFKKTDIRQLSGEEKSEYYFKTGYCYLKGDNLPMAEQSFQKILDAPSVYQGPANYYYAHIAYLKGDDDKALAGFKRLTEDETFRDIVPYYILHIQYRLQNYQEVISIGNQLTGKTDDKKNADLYRMIGDAYFKTGRYEESIPLLERYSRSSASRMNAQDWYQLGYAFYRSQKYDQAIQAFQKSVGGQDSLAQNAFYHLGDCYIKTGQKPFALNAFQSASKMDFDPAIKEDALFIYAMLAYDLSFDPYSEAIKSLKQYISDYPQSKRLDEANRYLVNLFLSTNNYQEAMETIEKIRIKDEQTRAAFQKAAHYRGIELFNGRDYRGATEMFKKSLEFPLDKNIQAANHYWLGESFYRLGSYDFAAEHYRKFLSLPDASRTPLYALTSYNLGYCYFNQKMYGQSIDYFRKFISSGHSEAQYRNDAYLRLGDSYLVNKRYDEAIDHYNKVIQESGSESDYATLQKAMAYGGRGDFARKAELLGAYLSKFPRSTYTEEVLYELGTTCILLNRDEEALNHFRRIPQEFPSGKYIKKSLLKTGLIYYNDGSNDLAITTLKKVISDYSGSEESREALEIIRNIYVDLNRVNEYLVFAQTLPFADMSHSAQDSLSYFTAEDRYRKGDCPGAIQGFEGYTASFPQGAFLIQAHFYQAECELRSNQKESALNNYLYVLQKPSSQFTENALDRVAAIRFEAGNYPEALESYQHLEEAASTKTSYITSLTGQMRCHFILENVDRATVLAERVLTSDLTEPEREAEANFILAKSSLATGNKEKALKAFQRTCELVQDERAAESQYHIAWLAYDEKAYPDAEKKAFELINRYDTFDYWVARGFILLSDIYAGMGNTFQAKQTLQSIIDNYSGEDLRSEAIRKLNVILTAEKASQNQLLQEEINEKDDS
ncbi:MAG: tetratricopeptide repeat protein [Bacteroidales bacterium]|nr:tetratricopeptide repeat protein [Bacteroidales bacterium]